jgi:alkanesulfonate monooxygenase SsuD/methylene tetrahydromethanopterin reductase-like flavin-dependent oxidoreductase (luciferase family)
VLVRLAVASERAGWDGVSTWDVLGTVMNTAAADPWVALTAIASRTEKVTLLASVIVLPRRRPQLVAQAAATLDRWSGGRLMLGIGAGGDPMDFTAFGESYDRQDRIPKLDRDAEAIDAWLRGEGDLPVGPRPVQVPRPPILVGGMRPGARRRAARWDGWIAVATSEDGSSMALSPDDFERMVQDVRAERAALGRAAEPLEIAVFGHSDPGEEQMVADFAATGATWWLESLSPLRGTEAELLARIEAGPAGR